MFSLECILQSSDKRISGRKFGGLMSLFYLSIELVGMSNHRWESTLSGEGTAPGARAPRLLGGPLCVPDSLAWDGGLGALLPLWKTAGRRLGPRSPETPLWKFTLFILFFLPSVLFLEPASWHPRTPVPPLLAARSLLLPPPGPWLSCPRSGTLSTAASCALLCRSDGFRDLPCSPNVLFSSISRFGVFCPFPTEQSLGPAS